MRTFTLAVLNFRFLQRLKHVIKWVDFSIRKETQTKTNTPTNQLEATWKGSSRKYEPIKNSGRASYARTSCEVQSYVRQEEHVYCVIPSHDFSPLDVIVKAEHENWKHPYLGCAVDDSVFKS